MSTLTEELPPDEADRDAGSVHDKDRTSRSLFDPSIIGPALGDAVRKLDPRSMARNPVMFIVEVGALLTTVLAVTDWGSNTGQQNVFAVSVAVSLVAAELFYRYVEQPAHRLSTAAGRAVGRRLRYDTPRSAEAETPKAAETPVTPTSRPVRAMAGATSGQR